uniref:Uncharacterized protein n=1 Tax=Arundo donax TaxID=35708 RepID=A0A0A8XN80_ARUDO
MRGGVREGGLRHGRALPRGHRQPQEVHGRARRLLRPRAGGRAGRLRPSRCLHRRCCRRREGPGRGASGECGEEGRSRHPAGCFLPAGRRRGEEGRSSCLRRLGPCL